MSSDTKRPPSPLFRGRAAHIAIALVFAALATSTALAQERISQQALEDFIDSAATAALEEGAVGLSIAVSFDDHVVFDEAFGLAEVEHGVKSDRDTSFRIGSITKQFTAALVMKQVEAGKISLDAPIGEYYDFPTGEHTVTVRHLLTHTSGIQSYTNLGPEWFKTIPLELTHQQLLDMVDDKPFEFPPGTAYNYNNTGYYLLGVILEEVTGKTYPELIKEEIAEPLGLDRTRYGSNRDIIKNRAQGYSKFNSKLANDGLIGMSQPGAAGALLSTAGDLVRWQEALAGGKVVSPASYALMTTPYETSDGESTGYGFGLGIGDADGLVAVRHGGGINGFNSMLTHFPATDVTIAVISNSETYAASDLATQIGRRIHGKNVEGGD